MEKNNYSVGDIILYENKLGQIIKKRTFKALIEMLQDGQQILLPYSVFSLVQSNNIELGVLPGKSFPSNEGD